MSRLVCTRTDNSAATDDIITAGSYCTTSSRVRPTRGVVENYEHVASDHRRWEPIKFRRGFNSSDGLATQRASYAVYESTVRQAVVGARPGSKVENEHTREWLAMQCKEQPMQADEFHAMSF